MRMIVRVAVLKVAMLSLMLLLQVAEAGQVASKTEAAPSQAGQAAKQAGQAPSKSPPASGQALPSSGQAGKTAKAPVQRPATAPETVVANGETGKLLDEYLTRLEKFGFSGAAIVSEKGEIILRKGYGWANREKKIPFTPATVSSIGSITKQFTAAAILKLEMMGKLKVQDSIRKYFPNVPADKASITLHQLLTHTAGFRGDFGGRDDDPIARDALVQKVLAAPLENKPGEVFVYSNEGYSLLGAIVEIVSGQPYEKFLREQLFLPAGMKDTGYLLPAWSADRIAHGYTEAGDWGTIRDKNWRADGPGWYLRANGGIHSTIGDMNRWAVALTGDKVLSKVERDKYQTGYVAEGPRGLSHYAYGWSIQTTPRNTKLVTHNGGNGIFFADFLRFVDDGATIFIFSNSTEQPATEASTPLARALFGNEFRMPPAVVELSAEELAKVAGTYQLESGENVDVSVADGRLKVAAAGPAFALVNGFTPAGSTAFAELEQRTKAAVEASQKGDYTVIQEAFGGEMPLENIRQQEEETWQRWRGRFGEFRSVEIAGTARRGPGIMVHVRVNFASGAPVLRFMWEEGRLAGIRLLGPLPAATFFPTSATEFATFNLRQPSVRMTFDVDGAGVATRLNIAGEGGALSAKKLGD
jgi:CubicO group peptidase (beta-lactamase class C family)